jgi:hypothetical protein
MDSAITIGVKNGTVGHPGQPPIIDGWHVSIERPECESLGITLRFENKRDAELAAEALRRAGFDSLEKLQAAKPQLRKLMCEALRW